jgi:hypothetical protein
MYANANKLHRKSGGAQWSDLRFGGFFVERFLDRGIMGLRPIQGDEKRVLFSDYCSLEAPPSPLSSRPELRRSAVEGSAVRPAALSNSSWATHIRGQ